VPDRDPFKLILKCPDCGPQGAAVRTRTAADQQFDEIGAGFHSETGRTRTGEALIICDACDTILDV
jgi:uncharacterized C2H2 Zn-finger protein